MTGAHDQDRLGPRPRRAGRTAGRALYPVALGLLVTVAAARADETLGPPIFTVRTVDDATAVGPITAIGPDWSVTIGGATPATVAGADIASIQKEGKPAPIQPSGSQIVQGDGSRLRCQIHDGTEDDVQVQSPILGEATVRMDRVRALLFDPPRDPGDLERILGQADRKTDTVLFRNGDQVAGTLEAITTEKLKLQGPLGDQELDRNQVAAIGLNPQLLSDPEPRGLYAQVLLTDGSRLALLEGSIKAGVLAGKPRFNPQTTIELPLAEIAQLRIRNGRQVYLSDLEPAAYRFEPYFDTAAPPPPYRRDQSFGGQPIRLKGRVYAKGLGVHSGATLVYRLDGTYRRFIATAGVDDEVGHDGLVTFRVVVDGVERFVSPPLTGGTAPVTIRLDIAGAKALSLVIGYTNFHNQRDHADWAAARLIRGRDAER